ncbi:unnamed protein product [Tilletia controversa]|uniref:40S ribosomal protein S25 n=2 Tax=Tilletia TaxID=13289 RepID=A0A9N8QCL0_9BASI|nr:unnamed protein product [Tilletia laevis]CAD6933598.1 unnamed protein product [Tilletia caries]CAD6942754.1 unnamed protein product [Tilletia caries]CAD6943010.1 unnamed protein product [Tilletia controversa]
MPCNCGTSTIQQHQSTAASDFVPSRQLPIATCLPPKKAAILASATKSNKKKKWSKGKVKDKAANAVVLDRPLYDRILKEVPTFKMISQSTLVDRLKINGSLARVAIKHLEREGQIKRIIHHHSQLVYTRTSGE